MACVPLVAHAEDPILQEAEALIRAGKFEDAYRLLEPLEIVQAGDLAYDYLLAGACLESDRLSQATFIYERILALRPDYVGVRADMGRAYYLMGDLAKARIEFETVLSFSNLPPDLRSAVQQYLAAMDKRARPEETLVTGYFEAGPGHDSNVNSATAANPVRLANGRTYTLDSTTAKRSSPYVSLAAGMEASRDVDGQLAVFAGGDLRGRGHSTTRTADNNTADGRIGLQYSSGNYLVRASVTAGRYWLNYVPTRDSQGLQVDWRLLIDDSNQLLVGGQATRYLYLPVSLRNYDFDYFSVSTGWLTALASTSTASVSMSLGAEKATRGRDDGDKNFYGLRGTLQHEFFSGLGSYVTAGYQEDRYANRNASFGVTRLDRLSDLTAGVVWSLQSRWSVRPQFSYSRSQSNVTINDYERHDASVTLRKDF